MRGNVNTVGCLVRRYVLLIHLVPLMLIPCIATGMEIKGFTQAWHDIALSLPESGCLEKLEVKEGDRVKQGELLLSLDSQIQALEVRRWQLQSQAKEDLKYAETCAAIYRQQYRSAENLRSYGAVISREEFEQKQLLYAQAVAELHKLKLKKELEIVELRLARQRLERRSLIAPVSGVIAAVMKELGEGVQAQEPVIRLIDASKGRFVANVEQSAAEQLHVGAKVLLHLLNRAENQVEARIIYIAPTVDTASGLLEIKADFNNPDEQFVLGSAALLVIAPSG